MVVGRATTTAPRIGFGPQKSGCGYAALPVSRSFRPDWRDHLVRKAVIRPSFGMALDHRYGVSCLEIPNTSASASSSFSMSLTIRGTP